MKYSKIALIRHCNNLPKVAIALFILCLSLGFEALASDVPPDRNVTLIGTAAGGVLSLMMVYGAPRYVSIQTVHGESAEVVLKRLAEKINQSDSFCWRGDLYNAITYSGRGPEAQVETNTLLLPGPAQYAFAGTDSGFEIPKPLLSFSGSYDPEKHEIRLYWISPSDRYDEILVNGIPLPQGTTNCVLDRKGREPNELFSGWLGAFVRRGAMISPATDIQITTDSQEELHTFPFFMGVAPNWSAWSGGQNPAAVKLEQGTKPEVPLKGYIELPDDKPFYQIIRTTENNAQGGVWRRFLGLRPGRTYRIEVRLNTLGMDAATNDWAFSFHAACDYPNGKGLTTAQMAGTAALPDGSRGPTAGQVALYGPKATTRGKWMKRSTDERGPGSAIQNITLPAGVTSITTWLRHSGTDSTGVGMDWIRVTDVTAASH